MAKKKKYVLSSQVDYSGIDWSGDEQVQQEREKAAVSNRLKETQSSVSSTNKFLSEDESRALDAKLAAKRAREAAVQARAAADKKAAEEAAEKNKWGSVIGDISSIAVNNRAALGHAVVDPLYEVALSNSRTGNTGTGVVPSYEVLTGMQANAYRNLMDAATGKRPLDLLHLTDSLTSTEGLEQEVKARRANQQARVEGSKALEIASGLARLPADLITGGGAYAAEDYNSQVEHGVSPEAALKHSQSMGALNLGANLLLPGGKVVTEAGLAAVKKVAPAAYKALKPAASKSAARLATEELAKHAVGTGNIMATYAGTELALNKATAEFSEDAAQRKWANDKLPENAGDLVWELGKSWLTGTAIGFAGGAKGSYMEHGRAKAESMMDIQNTMDDLARQERFKKDVEAAKAAQAAQTDNSVQPKAKVEPASNVRYGPLDQRPATEQLLFDATTAQGDGQLFPNAPRGNVKDNALTPPRFLTDKPQIGREQADMFGGRREYTKANPEVIEPEAPTSNVRDNLYRIQRQGQLFDSMPKQPDGTDTGVLHGPESNPDPNRPLFGESDLPVPDSVPELGTLTTRTLGEQREAEMAPHLEEAAKLEQQAAKQEQKTQASALKKAKAKWNADKRKAMLEARSSMLDLPEAERIKALADINKEWTAANPEPTLESLEAVRRSTAAPEEATTMENAPATPKASNEITLEELRELKPDATEADLAAANRTAAQSFDRLVKAVQSERDAGGLAQKGEAPSGRASLADIEAELKGNSSSGEVRTLNALQKNGHVRVVADESFLPEGASRMEGSKHGWFEGDTAYIVADKLEKGKVIQGMLDVAGHEVKHGVDTQGKPYQYSAISNKIIGTDANKRIVAKIEKLAENGDTTAKSIIDIAKENPKTYELEVAAYALNRANLERSKAGAFAGVSKDLLSTVRTSAKALIGSDNVNLNDLHYLGKRMLAEVAESRERLGKPDAGDEGLGMIVGKNHPRYQEFKDAGLVWEGPDGKERFVLSDASTKLNKDVLTDIKGNHKPVTLGALIKNNEAIKGYYSQIAKKKIVIDPELTGTNAYATGDTIAVSKKLIKDAIAGFKGENKLITTVLHETQHHIQRVEGHARGANVLDFMPPDDHAAYTAYHNATDALAENVKELETTRPDLHKAFTDDKMTLEEVGSELTKDPATEGFGYEILENQEIADFNKAASDKAFEDAHAKYRQTLGEQEAQLTERTAHLEQDELNPFPFDKDRVDSRPNVFNTESTVSTKRRIAGREADVLIKTPEGVTALKQDGSRERVPSWDATGKEMKQQEGMAYKGLDDQTETPEFKRWFKNSAVVDEAGNPLPVYHGTTSNIKIFSHDKLGRLTGADSAKKGFFFSSRKATGDYYAKADSMWETRQRAENTARKYFGKEGYLENIGPNTMEVYLSIQNPFVHDFKGKVYREESYASLIDKALTEGHDGVILKNTYDAGERSQLGTLFRKPEDVYVVFDSNQIKSATGNDGNFSTNDPNIFAYKGLKDDVKNAGKDARDKVADKLDEVDDFLQKIFFSSGKIGDQLMELIRQRGRDAAMMGEHAQSLRVAIGHSVKELMSAKKWTSEQAADFIANKIEKLSKVKSVEAREALALDIAKNDPIMAPVIDGFRQINDATRILIRQELEANPHITTERLKQLQSMWDNQWSYTTRAYAAFQGAEGKAYAKTVMDLAYRARDRMARGLKLSKNEAKYHGIVEAATKVIKNSDLTMPKDLSKITDGKRESLYDAWVPGEGYATKKAGLISRAIEAGKDKDTATMEAIAKLTDELEAYRPRSEDAKELQAKADYIAESILGLRDSSDSIAKVYRGAKADDSIMKHRTDMPEEIRALLGEISDPGLLLSLTLMKQGELIASNKLLRQIKKQGEAAGWIMPRAEAYKNKKMGTPIQEDYLGTLKGMVTTPEIAAVLNTSVEHINGSGQILTRALVDVRFGLNGFANIVDSKVQMAARGWKRVTVAYNPYSYGRDFVGSSVTLLANGTLLSNPIKQLDYYGKGGKLAIENIVGTAKGGSATYSVLFDDAIKHGLFESVKVHELRTAFGDSLRSEINPSNSAALNRKLIKYLKRGDATVIQARAMADAWTKIPIWLERVDALSRYYEANGVKKTISEIKAEAGRDMRKTTVTQEQVPVFAKFLETRGLTTFLPYYIASARALKNNFEMGYMDIVRGLTEATTPEARNIMLVSGTKRLAGSSMAVGVVTYGMQSLADWWNAEGNTEEERKKSLDSVDALKQLMFPNSRYGEVLYTGKNEKGEPVFISLSAVDPSGPIGDVLRVLANNDISDEEKGDAILKSAFDTLTSLNKGPLDMLWFGLGAVNGKTTHKGETKIERIAPTMARYIREKMTANDFHNFSRNDANNFLQIISDYTPGAANALDSGNKIVSDGNPLGKVIMYAGGRMETANVGAVLGGTASALKEYRTDTKTSVYEMVKEGSSPEAIFKYVSKRAEKEQEMTTKIRDSYKALTVGLGYSQSKAVATLRGARLDARDIVNATKDKPHSSVYEMLNDPKGPLNAKGMATWAQNRARRKNGDEKTAAKEGRELMNKFRVLHLKSGAIQQYVDDKDEGDEDDN